MSYKKNTAAGWFLSLLLLGAASVHAQPTKFVITGSATQTAGTGQDLTVRADSAGSAATSYSGVKKLIFSGANASLNPVTQPTVTDTGGVAISFGDTVRINFTAGVATVSTGTKNGRMVLYRAEPAIVSVTDGTILSAGADRLAVTVSAGSLGKFTFVLATPQVNASTFTGTNTLTAQDAWGNTVTTFNAAADAVTVTTTLSGTVSGLGSGSTNILNRSGDFASGVANLTGTIRYTGTAGSGTFTATSSTTNSGTSNAVTILAGPASKVRVETAVDGSGTIVPVQNVPSGSSITVYSISRDVSDNFVSNIAADVWSLQGITGGVVAGDLSPSGNRRNATFTGNLVGSAQIRATSGALAPTNSGTQTVVAGTATQVRVETAADGSGVVVPAQIVSSGDSITVYAVSRDNGGNYVANIPSTWSLTGVSGGVVGGDLVPSGDTRSARFKGRLIGTAQIRAVSVPLSSVNSGTLTVTAGAAARLVIAGSANQTAGTTQNLSLTASDAAGNTATGYTGLKTLTFSGADSSLAPSVPPTVTNSTGSQRAFGSNTSILFSSGVANVSGGNNGVLRLYRAQAAVVSVTDGAISSTGSDRLTVTVNPASLNKFAFDLTSPQQNGVPFNGTNTLTAQDSWGNPVTSFNAASNNVTVTTSLSGSVTGLGSGGTNVLNQAGDFVAGVANLTGQMTYTGTIGAGTFTATSGANSGTSASVSIVAGGATRLVITGSATQTAGVSQNLTITARDASGNVVTTYAGIKSLTFTGANPSPDPATPPTVVDNGGTARLFGQPMSISFSSGVASVSAGRNGVMTLYESGTTPVSISVFDGMIGSFGGDRLQVTVSPAVLSKFEVQLTSPQTNGAPFVGVNTVTAQDAYGNTLTAFNAQTTPVTVTSSLVGTITGLGSAGNNILNQVSDFSAGVANLTNRMVFTGTTGPGSFRARVGAGQEGISGTVTIQSGAATRIVITGAGTQTAGTTQNLTITLRDNSGNIVPFTGTRTMTFSGSGPSPNPVTPPTVSNTGGTNIPFGTGTLLSFSLGVATVSGQNNGVLRLYRAGTDTIGVTDGTVVSTGSDRLVVTVPAGLLGKFDVAFTSPQVNGQTFTGTNTVTAQDDWGNTVTTFNALANNVMMTTSLSGTISGLGSGGNNVLNRSTDFVTGVANLTGKIRYTGPSGDGTFTATSGVSNGISPTVTIASGVAARLVVTGSPTQSAGNGQNLTITAQDSSGNVVALYAGTKSIVFSGATASTDPVTSPTVSNSAGTAIPFGQTTLLTFVSGRTQTSSGANGVMRLYHAGVDTISVTDGTLSSRGVDRLVVRVSPGNFARFRVSIAPSQTVGTPFTGTNTLTASDDFGNTITDTTVFNPRTDNVAVTSGLTGLITGLGSLGNNVLNRSSDFTQGVANLTGKMVFSGQGGSGSFTATSETMRTGNSTPVTLNNPVPSLTAINPGLGNRSQSLSITLTGTKFFVGVTVANFGPGITVDSVLVNSSTSMVAWISIGQTASLGPRNVWVTNTGPGGGSDTLANGLDVRNVPSLAAIDPASGLRGQSLTLTLTGTNFQSGVSTVGIIGPGVTLGSPTIVNPTTMTLSADIRFDAQDGARQIFVVNSGVYGGVSENRAFSVGSNPAPGISSITPDNGARLETFEVLVRGIEFYNGLTTLSLGDGISVGSLVIDSVTVLRAMVSISDSAATSLRSVYVTNAGPGGGTDSLQNRFMVNNPAPTVTNVSPQTATRLQQQMITVTGTRFIRGVTSVSLGSGILVDSIRVQSPTGLTARITVDSTAVPGVRDLVVENAGPGGGTDTLIQAFTINNPGAILADVDPDSVLVGAVDLTVTLTGSSFVPESIVRLDNLGLPTTFVNTGRLTAIIDENELDTARVYAITVFSPGAGVSNSRTFTVKNPAPTLAMVAPDSAVRLQTVDLVVTGTGFVPGFTGIAISPPDDLPVTSLRVNGPTQLTATILVGEYAAIGPRTFTVWNPLPGGGMSPARTFTISGNPVPGLNSFTPETATRLQTLEVAFTGSNFLSGVTGVNFGPNIVVNSVTVDTSTRLRANITIGAAAATGFRQVSLTNAPPGGGTSSSRVFDITNPVPVLSVLQPSNGEQLQNYDLVVRGRNFVSGVTTLDMGGGISVSNYTVLNDTTLTARISITILAAIGPRDIYVENESPGGGRDTLVGGFVVGVNPAPGITSINPAQGGRLDTTDVVFTGSGYLGGVTTVDFGPGFSVLSVNVQSGTQLTARITIADTVAPGPRNVFVINGPPGGGRDSLLQAFSVVNPLPRLLSISPEHGDLAATMEVLIRGSRFISGVSSVGFGGTGIRLDTTVVNSDTQMTVTITIASQAPLGPQTFRVTNAPPGGGQSGSLQFTITVPGSVSPALRSPLDGQQNLPQIVRLTWSPQVAAQAYHVQLAGDAAFSNLMVNDSTVTDTTRDVGPLNGTTEYHWRVRSKHSGIFGAFSAARSFRTGIPYPPSYPLTNSISFPIYNNPATYSATQYRIVGLPGSPGTPVRDVLTGTHADDWQVYWDNGAPAASAGLVPYDGSSTFVFSTGRGFWVIRKGNLTINTTVPTAPLDTSGSVLIPLHPGWNLITNPFVSAATWSVIQAANGPAAVGPLYGYTGSFSFATAMQPYVGYYFDNSGNRTGLRIPLSATGSASKAASDVTQEGWRVTLELRAGDWSERIASFGVSPGAESGRDEFDHRKPRAVGTVPEVYFDRPGWDPGNGVFATDIRGEVGEIETWEFDVVTARREGLTLSLDGLAGIPQSLAVALADHTRGRAVDLAEKHVVSVDHVVPRHRFAVLVGTPSAVRDHLNGLIPREFALDQNFPNPFNPATTILVEVPRVSDVTLTVYSLLGENVRTLHSGSLVPGRHFFTWDGRDDRGIPVASGVYLSRLTTGDGPAFTRKMMLLK